MAHVRKRKIKRGTVYTVEVRVAGHKPVSRTFDKKSQAYAWGEKREEQIRLGIPAEGEAAKGDMHLGVATDRFLDEVIGKSLNTINDYRYSQRQLLKYFGDDMMLSEITKPFMSRYMAKRMKDDGVGASKIRAELTFIRLVYEKASEWGVEIPSPEKDIKRPVVKRKSREDGNRRNIKPEEMNALLTEAKNRRNNLYWYLLFLLHTGMRPSEAAAMHWEQLPTRQERILENQKKHIGYVDQDRRGFSMVGTKTETRFVPAHPIVWKILEQLPRESQYVFLPDRSKLPANNQPINFDKQPDRPYHFFRRSFETSRKNARVDDKPIRQDIDFYSFRHTARSRMAACGIQDSAAELIIGHADKKKEMVSIYTHYDDEGLVEVIKKLEYPWLKPF